MVLEPDAGPGRPASIPICRNNINAITADMNLHIPDLLMISPPRLHGSLQPDSNNQPYRNHVFMPVAPDIIIFLGRN